MERAIKYYLERPEAIYWKQLLPKEKTDRNE
jgi:hypothetical protein